jgi:hypothetical protein
MTYFVCNPDAMSVLFQRNNSAAYSLKTVTEVVIETERRKVAMSHEDMLWWFSRQMVV